MYQELEAAVRIGDVLASKYRVDRVLGVGGMGVVVAATHLQLDQIVALKFVRAEALHNPEIISRFEREARAAVRLKSEHTARIIDVGRLDSGSPYIVMEYLEGLDLAHLLEQRRALPVALACDYVIQACDAIAEAHRLGIVHRDLKPGNLFLANGSHGQQVIKVLDFGISKSQATAGDPSMTRTQAVMGSPGYMSPEQMRSTKSVDGRTDVWSLGVILYELVAGRVPFQADTFSALCVKIAVDPHPPMLGLPASLPPGFEAVVNRALEKDPTLRFQSAVELALALAPFAGPQARERAQRLASAVGAMPSAAYPIAMAPGANTIDAASGQARRGTGLRAGRSRALVIAGVGIAAAAVIGIAIGVGRTGGAGGGGGAGGDGGSSRGGASAPETATGPRPAPPPPEVQRRVIEPPPQQPAVTPPPPPVPVVPVVTPVPEPVRDAGVDAPPVAPPAPAPQPPPGKQRVKQQEPAVDPFKSPD